MDCEVAPVDHKYDDPELAVSDTKPFEQNVVGPEGVMEAVGVEPATTATGWLVETQPFELVIVTE